MTFPNDYFEKWAAALNLILESDDKLLDAAEYLIQLEKSGRMTDKDIEKEEERFEFY